VVFAPFEADHQLVSLQRAGIIDIILSEDGDLTHLGARAGSVLSNYITRRATGYRYQYYQPDSTARPRSIRAALLGTDYNHNLNLVNWNMVDATTEKLVLGLGGSSWA
jgi:5'-3' exonuclease